MNVSFVSLYDPKLYFFPFVLNVGKGQRGDESFCNGERVTLHDCYVMKYARK